MSFLNTKKRLLGLLTGTAVLLLKKKQKKITPKDLEFSTSTQRMGVYFPEEKHRFWRKKWVFLSKNQ